MLVAVQLPLRLQSARLLLHSLLLNTMNSAGLLLLILQLSALKSVRLLLLILLLQLLLLLLQLLLLLRTLTRQAQQYYSNNHSTQTYESATTKTCDVASYRDCSSTTTRKHYEKCQQKQQD